VAVVSRWLVDLAFAAPPQSGLTWLCFLFPLIEPDMQISRIRLSEKTHACCLRVTQSATSERLKGFVGSSPIPRSLLLLASAFN
jgi:hypothetical protein